MIYITGDTHGEFSRFKSFCERFATSAKDTMIVLGDAGLNFYLDARDTKKKDYVATLPITFFFIHGNHEERPYLCEGYEEADYRGGRVYINRRYPNQIFAKDGEIFDFDGKKTAVIGGAYSVDKEYRLSHGWPWFASEQPDAEIKRRAEEKLAAAGWKVDCVLTHTAPIEREPRHMFLSGIDQTKVDKTTELFLQTIANRLEFDRWYFGHYHGEWHAGRYRMLFTEIEEFMGE